MNDFMAESSLPRSQFPQGVSGFGKGKEAGIIFQLCIQHGLLNTMGFLIVGGGVEERVLTKWEGCHQVLGLWQSLQGPGTKYSCGQNLTWPLGFFELFSVRLGQCRLL